MMKTVSRVLIMKPLIREFTWWWDLCSMMRPVAMSSVFISLSMIRSVFWVSWWSMKKPVLNVYLEVNINIWYSCKPQLPCVLSVHLLVNDKTCVLSVHSTWWSMMKPVFWVSTWWSLMRPVFSVFTRLSMMSRVLSRHTQITDIFADFRNSMSEARIKFIGVLVDCKKK